MIFQEKYFPCYVLLTYQISLPDYIYFFRYWAICVLVLFVINFEINLSNQSVFLHNQKDKNVNILRTKIAFKVK